MTTALRIKPMLAETTDTDKLPKLALEDRYCFQQKVDGHRKIVHIIDGRVSVLNRQGEPSSNGLPNKVIAQFARMRTGQWFFDGELVDDTFWLFDLPTVDGRVKLDDPYRFRMGVLEAFFAGWAPDPCVRLLPTAWTAEDKLRLAARLVDENAEGVIVKDVDAPYLSGKRSRHILKAKFVHDADCVVIATKVAGKDAMTLGLYNKAGKLVEVGRCTMLAGDKDRIQPGDVVCVKYLYAVDPRAPRLYQPTYPLIRDDKGAAECTLDQLHFTNKGVIA